MRTAFTRREATILQNRKYFEKSLANKDMIDIREYLPVSHLMSAMMKQDREWLDDNYPELVLVHMGSPYYDKL